MASEFLNNFQDSLREQELECRFLKYEDMMINKPYPVRKIRMANTGFGERIRIYLQTGVYSLSGTLSRKMINKYKKQRIVNKLVKGIRAKNLALVIKGRVGEGAHKRVDVTFEPFENINPDSETDSDYSSCSTQQQQHQPQTQQQNFESDTEI